MTILWKHSLDSTPTHTKASKEVHTWRKTYVAEPDLQFTKDLIAAGAGDLKKCYQCATCSVACKIAPDNNPFPRKEMIWAQWGLKDKLLNDPDVWLCHQCNDCSTMCPRGANPGDALKAVRKMVIQNNAKPAFFGKLVGESSMFVLALGIPAVVVLFILLISGFSFPEGAVKYSAHHLSPKDGFIYLPLVQIIFTAALVFSVVSLVMSLKSYWTSLESNNPIPVGSARKGFIPSLLEALSEILPHTTFKECEANNIRYSAHLLTFWGMIGLLVTTAIVAFNVDILGLLPPSQKRSRHNPNKDPRERQRHCVCGWARDHVVSKIKCSGPGWRQFLF